MRCGAPPKAPVGVQEGIVVELVERLERHTETPAVIQNRAVVMWNPPWAGIEIKTVFELAGLGDAAEFGEGIAAPQGSSYGPLPGC